MSLLSPLGLLALLAVPAILVLHLYRRRPQVRRVSAAFLFATGVPDSDAGRQRMRVRNQASLVLELLAAIAIALWLAEPRFGISADPRTLVLVLDDSASMLALGGDGRSACDRARGAAVAALDALPDDTRFAVVRSGTRPAVLAGPNATRDEALAALRGWLPRQLGHDLAVAVDLAVELAGERGDVLVLSDGDPGPLASRVRLLAFGEARANAAIASARRLRLEDGRAKVLCDLACFGALQRGVVRVLGPDGQPRAETAIELEIDAPKHVALELPDAEEPWHLQIVIGGDALAIDDSCALPAPLRRDVRLASALDPASAAALEIERVVAALDAVTLVEQQDADLSIRSAAGDGTGHELVIAALPGETDAWLGPFLVDRRAGPALGVTLDGVVWSAGRGPMPGVPFVLAGEQALASIERLGRDLVRVHLDLDPARSNLQRSPDWPILLQNIVELARATLPGPERSIVPVGSAVRWREAPVAMRIEGPSGEEVPATGTRERWFEAREPGLYRALEGERVLGHLAAWFVDLGESELRTRRAFERTPTADAPAVAERVATGTDLERRILALLAMLFILGDVFVTRARTGGGAA